MTVYRGCILIEEEFLQDWLALPGSGRGSIKKAIWEPAEEVITLAWQDDVDHDVPWSSIMQRIPGQPPTPVNAYVEPRIGIGLAFEGETQGEFLKPQHGQEHGLFCHGVLTAKGYRHSTELAG